jgi:Fe2+ or Zn2+ uptake regulation protein
MIVKPFTKREEVMVDVVEYNGKTVVAIVDGNGKRVSCGTLVEFEDDGTLRLATNVKSDTGFKLDSLGRVIVRAE